MAIINFLNFALAESPVRVKGINTRRVLGEGLTRQQVEAAENEFAGDVRDLADAEHGGRVAVVAGEDRRDVDVHDVAILEDGVCIRDAVADNFVDADAGVARITVIAHAGGDALVLASVVSDEFIDFEGGNAGLAHFARTDQRFGSESAGVADQFDFFCGFYFDLCHLRF